MRPASMHPGDMGRCGGSSAATAYFLLEPTDTNPKNNFPDSEPFTVRIHRTTYHLQNVALLPWYTGAAQGLGSTYSFPNAQTLSAPAAPCPAHREQEQSSAEAVAAIPEHGAPNGHKLIGYWTGSRFSGGKLLPLRDVSPQWDIILVAFASPDKSGPEGTLRFKPPVGITPEQLKSDIAYLKRRGKKVMISLGGGGQYFTLDNRSSVPTFVHCVTQIVSEYGFDGIDLDFEAPSLELDPGDTDFRHPQTPSTVNLIAALRELHNHFGPGFMISLVPEGSQIPAGYPTYGGQFGSYLPLTYAIRDILSFIDVQSYNTPPLEGLDGEIYQPNTVDYHAAMTDLLLNGFDVGGNPDEFFPPLPANKVAIGFLIGDTTPTIVSQAMSYIITGHAPAGTTYKLREPQGYPGMIGAMFWTIDADQQGNYLYSNVIGPQLHNYPPSDQK
jgi:chitinase